MSRSVDVADGNRWGCKSRRKNIGPHWGSSLWWWSLILSSSSRVGIAWLNWYCRSSSRQFQCDNERSCVRVSIIFIVFFFQVYDRILRFGSLRSQLIIRPSVKVRIGWPEVSRLVIGPCVLIKETERIRSVITDEIIGRVSITFVFLLLECCDTILLLGSLGSRLEIEPWFLFNRVYWLSRWSIYRCRSLERWFVETTWRVH